MALGTFCVTLSHMPPKTRYTKDHVLEAALEVVHKDGLEAMSARTIAGALGSSTAPVSAAFENMQALQDAVVHAIITQLLAKVDVTSHKSDPVHGAAFAIARFTADHPRYYEALFLHNHPTPPDWAALRLGFSKNLESSARYAHLDARQRDALAWRASVVTHGICIEIWSGRWTKTSDAALKRLIDQLVEPIIYAAMPEALGDP